MIARLWFYLSTDRVGPDMPFTQWILYFPKLARVILRKRFYAFSPTAEVRPGSYLLNTRTISLGKNVVIRPGSYIAGETIEHTGGKPSIVIEDDALISPGVHVYPSNHNYSDPDIPIMYQGDSSPKTVTIKSGAWIGANVIILPGVTVGKNAVVGAGAVVRSSVPDYAVAFGNPATSVAYKE